jgi:serine/threonine protein phosphatase PrpC
LKDEKDKAQLRNVVHEMEKCFAQQASTRMLENDENPVHRLLEQDKPIGETEEWEKCDLRKVAGRTLRMSGDEGLAHEQFDRIVVRTMSQLCFGIMVYKSIPEEETVRFSADLREHFLGVFYGIGSDVQHPEFTERLGHLSTFLDVTIYCAANCLKGMNLCDTAGVLDSDPVKRRRTAEEIETCDMAIVVLVKNLQVDGGPNKELAKCLNTILLKGGGVDAARVSFVHNSKDETVYGSEYHLDRMRKATLNVYKQETLRGVPAAEQLIDVRAHPLLFPNLPAIKKLCTRLSSGRSSDDIVGNNVHQELVKAGAPELMVVLEQLAKNCTRKLLSDLEQELSNAKNQVQTLGVTRQYKASQDLRESLKEICGSPQAFIEDVKKQIDSEVRRRLRGAEHNGQSFVYAVISEAAETLPEKCWSDWRLEIQANVNKCVDNLTDKDVERWFPRDNDHRPTLWAKGTVRAREASIGLMELRSAVLPRLAPWRAAECFVDELDKLGGCEHTSFQSMVAELSAQAFREKLVAILKEKKPGLQCEDLAKDVAQPFDAKSFLVTWQKNFRSDMKRRVHECITCRLNEDMLKHVLSHPQTGLDDAPDAIPRWRSAVGLGERLEMRRAYRRDFKANLGVGIELILKSIFTEPQCMSKFLQDSLELALRGLNRTLMSQLTSLYSAVCQNCVAFDVASEGPQRHLTLSEKEILADNITGVHKLVQALMRDAEKDWTSLEPDQQDTWWKEVGGELVSNWRSGFTAGHLSNGEMRAPQAVYADLASCNFMAMLKLPAEHRSRSVYDATSRLFEEGELMGDRETWTVLAEDVPAQMLRQQFKVAPNAIRTSGDTEDLRRYGTSLVGAISQCLQLSSEAKTAAFKKVQHTFMTSPQGHDAETGLAALETPPNEQPTGARLRALLPKLSSTALQTLVYGFREAGMMALEDLRTAAVSDESDPWALLCELHLQALQVIVNFFERRILVFVLRQGHEPLMRMVRPKREYCETVAFAEAHVLAIAADSDNDHARVLVYPCGIADRQFPGRTTELCLRYVKMPDEVERPTALHANSSEQQVQTQCKILLPQRRENHGDALVTAQRPSWWLSSNKPFTVCQDRPWSSNDGSVICVFDGVGECGDKSLQTVRLLRNATMNVWEKLTAAHPPPPHNLAHCLLQTAHTEIRKAFNALPRSAQYETGATTATALFLREQGKLHACNVGDSLWVVLRKSGSEMYWRPTKWCGAMYTRRHDGRFAPKQLSEDRDAHDGDFSAEMLDLQAGDVVLVASDGLWDNLDGRYVEGKPLAFPEQRALVWELPDPVNEQDFAEALERQVKTLLEKVVANMHTKPTLDHAGKPDDLTLVAAYAVEKPRASVAPVHAPGPAMTPPPSPSSVRRSELPESFRQSQPDATAIISLGAQPTVSTSPAAHVAAPPSAMDTGSDSDSDCYIVDPP